MGFKERYVLHSLRNYWASTMAQQGIPPMVLTKMFGHTDVRLIMKVYDKQHNDALMQAKLSEMKAELRWRLHDPIPVVGQWLRSVVIGQLALVAT